ncbi:hypothetical protein QBC43DRAFT_359169 [Cladorrhinum sp. PSN259]|nr:hypothetical protein QBC43DRAFT_359169 [Cladorrhinum sp. PSN259]
MNLIALAGLARVSLALPSPFTPDRTSNHRLDESNDQPCQFDDGWGPIDCGYFSITFGNIDSQISNDTCARFLASLNGQDFQDLAGLSCDNEGDVWNSISTSALPYVVGIHTGNLCLEGYSCNDYAGWYDNTWIKYADQFLNTPTDNRCSFMAWDQPLDRHLSPVVVEMMKMMGHYKEKRKSLRCIIPKSSTGIN